MFFSPELFDLFLQFVQDKDVFSIAGFILYISRTTNAIDLRE